MHANPSKIPHLHSTSRFDLITRIPSNQESFTLTPSPSRLVGHRGLHYSPVPSNRIITPSNINTSSFIQAVHPKSKLENKNGKTQYPFSRLKKTSNRMTSSEKVNPFVSNPPHPSVGSLEMFSGESDSDCEQLTTQTVPPLYETVSFIYENIDMDSPANILFHYIKKRIPYLSPLQHESMYDVDPTEYPHTVYEPRSSRSALFWNFWSDLYPDIGPLALYKLALQHGVRVTHRVKTQHAKAALPHRWFRSEKSTPIPPYIRNHLFQETVLLDTDPISLNKSYILAVQALLTRDNARGFVERGGLAWRIAIEFGSKDLWADTFRGPSSSVVRYFEGELIIDGHDEEDWICEKPLVREEQLLVGTIFIPGSTDKSRSSLFPPLHVFESSKHWNGVWTHENEIWFQTMLTRLREDQLKPKIAHNWVQWGRSHRTYISEECAESWNRERETLLIKASTFS
jgi:hypothetical protein